VVEEGTREGEVSRSNPTGRVARNFTWKILNFPEKDFYRL
jgi:hypothetical protein